MAVLWRSGRGCLSDPMRKVYAGWPRPRIVRGSPQNAYGLPRGVAPHEETRAVHKKHRTPRGNNRVPRHSRSMCAWRFRVPPTKAPCG
jgi:hypothetical protein